MSNSTPSTISISFFCEIFSSTRIKPSRLICALDNFNNSNKSLFIRFPNEVFKTPTNCSLFETGIDNSMTFSIKKKQIRSNVYL